MPSGRSCNHAPAQQISRSVASASTASAPATRCHPTYARKPSSAGGVPAEWTSTPAADPHRVILFLHGGAYIAGSIRSHRHMIAEAGRQAHARTLALDYRLAPEHPFPAAPHDALAAYRFLLSSGFDPGNIALAGESAGGGLALATLISLRDENTPLPAHVWLSSPWTDLTMTGETMTTKAAVDPLIQRAYLQETAALYLNGTDPTNPLVSPINADLHGLPPMLIQIGTAETLLSDSPGLLLLQQQPMSASPSRPGRT